MSLEAGVKRRVITHCPCGERTIGIASPPHQVVEFDQDGLLTVRKSLNGQNARGETCHFYITRGLVSSICSDTTCPLSKMAVEGPHDV